jgi:hypothetical protein
MQYNFSLLSFQQLPRQLDVASLEVASLEVLSTYTLRQVARHSLPDCLHLHVHQSVDIRAVGLLQDPA